MFKKNGKIKFILLALALVLPTVFGLICTKLNYIPGNSADPGIFGTALLPEKLAASSSLQLFQIVLLCAMIIITAILTGIALSKRMSDKNRLS
jgi:hypothetical protein